MTVKQLIEKLYEMPQNMGVFDECNSEILDVEVSYDYLTSKYLVMLKTIYGELKGMESWDK